MKKPTKARREVMLAVLQGKLDESHITLDEIKWLETAVMDAVIEKLALTNPAVFSEVNKGLTN
ncbi:hypothetical protein UFOVP181_461 [uncultured Caudovirales phage]|uniref:Uncharacterized protein n=1 Tax=uncultured Caudovirales phage TaxID=2100421 RepID=A0A6J5KT73_9CAUD|nr:hypothetical protein UFOVP57_180 [uncultured Caudovirales phage]CAB5209394.1 hypothetical protein UFOVP181_461 [uncultured Caudovirales phage]